MGMLSAPFAAVAPATLMSALDGSVSRIAVGDEVPVAVNGALADSGVAPSNVGTRGGCNRLPRTFPSRIVDLSLINRAAESV